MGKAAVILSLLLNVAILGALGTAYLTREADSQFVLDYMQLPQEDRNFLRGKELKDWIADAKAQGAKTPEILKSTIIEYARDDSERQTILGMIKDDPTVGVQRLVTDAVRLQRIGLAERAQEAEASVERINMLNGEFPDFIEQMNRQEEDLKNREKNFDVNKERWLDLAKDKALQLAITSISEAKKPKDAVKWLEGLSVDKQWYVISNLSEPETRNQVMLALPEADQVAIKRFMTRPIGGQEAEATAGSGD